MFLAKTPRLLQTLMPFYTWHIPSSRRVLYLTFDDGPIPDITPWVLDTLRSCDAKATFFCVGDNVYKHPSIYRQIREEGHAVGNHTYNHLNGWKTGDSEYLQNVRRCSRVVKSDLFRPPYGRLMPRQREILQRHFRIVMWDVLSGDYDAGISPEQCLRNVTGNAQPGSIIVMHDSLKAGRNLRFALPALLEYFAERQYGFEKLTPEMCA